MATESDDYRTETVDATIQMDDNANLPEPTADSSSRIAIRPDTLHLLSPMLGSCVPISLRNVLFTQTRFSIPTLAMPTKCCLDNWFVLPNEIIQDW